MDVAARFRAGEHDVAVGGDFYDVFRLSVNDWGLAIGDVCGKGIEAAALTGLARHTLRAAARHSTSPTEVLLAVHQALRDHRPATFCTACFAFITRQGTDSLRVELSLGGHPQPLLRHSDGRVEPVGTLGMLLGMIEPTIANTVAELEPGDTFVFYTDGLTDAPAEQAVTVEELAALLELEGDQPVEQLADTIRAVKRGRRPLGSGDDTALLILRFDGVPATSPDKTAASGDEPATSSVTGS